MITSVVVIVVVISGVIWLGFYLGWLGGAPATTDDKWTFNITNSTKQTLDADEVLGYVRTYDKSIIDDFNDDDWNAIAGTDLTLETSTISHGESLTPQDNVYYWAEFNGTGYNTVEIYLSSVDFGTVNITMLATPAACAISAINEAGNTSIANSTGHDLRIFVSCFDADGDINSYYGYRTTVQYSVMASMKDCALSHSYNMIVFTTNTTIATGDIELDSALEVDVTISTTSVYFCFTQDFVGLTYFDFDLSANLGITFDLSTSAFAVGTPASSTTIDTLA